MNLDPLRLLLMQSETRLLFNTCDKTIITIFNFKISGGGGISGPLPPLYETLVMIQFCTKVHYACQKQFHVCLGSHLTKPCLSCVVTSKTAAIHVRCQHSMHNFLSCKILLGPHPTAWDQEGLPLAFLMPTGV